VQGKSKVCNFYKIFKKDTGKNQKSGGTMSLSPKEGNLLRIFPHDAKRFKTGGEGKNREI